MRVSDNLNFDMVKRTLNRSKGKLEKLQSESATLKRIQSPSDDPIGSTNVLAIRTQEVNNLQFWNACQKVKENLEQTDQALDELSEVVVRCKELILHEVSEGSASDVTRESAAQEVHQLFEHGLSISNRKIGERYLFGGFRADRPPVDGNGYYQGDSGQIQVEVSLGVFMPLNVPGSTVLVQSDLEGGSSRLQFFELLDELEIGLQTGSLELLRDRLDALDEMHNYLVGQRAKVGARLQGLATSQSALERGQVQSAALKSSIEDADLAEVAVNLGREETLLKSALQASKKLLQPSLLEFLR